MRADPDVIDPAIVDWIGRAAAVIPTDVIEALPIVTSYRERHGVLLCAAEDIEAESLHLPAGTYQVGAILGCLLTVAAERDMLSAPAWHAAHAFLGALVHNPAVDPRPGPEWTAHVTDVLIALDDAQVRATDVPLRWAVQVLEPRDGIAAALLAGTSRRYRRRR